MANFRLPTLRCFLLLNGLALVLVSIWFRCHWLENMPGVNGDEAWSGVQGWHIAHGGPVSWQTPMGNPINLLFAGPVALLHLWLPPSTVLLRLVAVASGLAALGVNWWFCRWVFDRRTAAIGTVALAVLPINIAYSRLAWDASQTLAATLPVIYLALAAVRYPRHGGRLIVASIFALAIAVWVHPTNLFASVAIPIAYLVSRRLVKQERDKARTRDETGPPMRSLAVRVLWLAAFALAGVVFAFWICTAQWVRGPLPGQIADRLRHAGELFAPHTLAAFSTLYPRLFTGATVFRYIAGSRSWFEWPLPADMTGWGLDVGLFWACMFGSAWLLWRAWRPDDRLRPRSPTDGALLMAWALEIVAFLLVATPQAMTPGAERYSICLIGPAMLVLARGASLAWEAASPRWRVAMALATLAAWPVLADFQTHFFDFIERTGGQSHLTYRTAAVEPKQAALQYILDNVEGTADTEKWIVCSQWWNRLPIRYWALSASCIRVPEPETLVAADEYRQALAEGRVWFVEFCDSEGQRQAEAELAGRTVERKVFADYAGRPLLCVLHATDGKT